VARAKEGGYLTVELYFPEAVKEAMIHFKFPENVGEVINCLPKLIEEAKEAGNDNPYVEIGLQLLEVTHKPTKEDIEHLLDTQTVVRPLDCSNLKLDESQKIDSETAAFADYLKSDDKEEPGPQAVESSEGMSMKDWERMEADKKRRLDALLEKQREKDQQMFGFKKFKDSN